MSKTVFVGKCKRILCVAFVAAVALCAQPVFCAEKAYGNIEKVNFVGNYDGDTITVDIPGYPDIVGNHIHVRLKGIDTPEMKGHCQKEIDMAHNAKRFAYEKLVNAKHIALYDISRGKYFRIVSSVIVDGSDLSNMLVEQGLAVPYDGGTKTKNWCE